MTEEQVIEIATKVYGNVLWRESNKDKLLRFAGLVAEHEREACAKEAEQTFYSVQAAENIRARGQE